MMLAKRVMPAVTNPRESSETFRHLIEGVQDVAIFMLDGAGRVSTWNSGAERIKGYRAEEIVGQHFSRFYPPEAVAEGKPARLLAIAARDGRVEDEGWRVRKDGARFWAEVRSEEHTSELQSRLHLVCRLLLEKKKKNKNEIIVL